MRAAGGRAGPLGLARAFGRVPSPANPLSRVRLALFAVCALAGSAAFAQGAPGLTGAKHADDVVMARQLLMDAIDTEMGAIEGAVAGSKIDLVTLKDRAYT